LRVQRIIGRVKSGEYVYSVTEAEMGHIQALISSYYRDYAISWIVTSVALFGAATRSFAQPLQFQKERISHADGSSGSLTEPINHQAVELSFRLAENGWVNLSASLRNFNKKRPVTFTFQVTSPCMLELKFLDADGSTFGQRVAVEPRDQLRRLTIYPHEAEYWWGESKSLGTPKSFDLAVSGAIGSGRLTIVDAMIGKANALSSFGPVIASSAAIADVELLRVPYRGPLLDPDRELPGFGKRQRRAEQMLPEAPLVLEWLKVMQDTSTPDRQLLTSTPSGDELHTFNNVLAAMAFMRSGERERAERILDFFRDAARDSQNSDPTRQSFYLNGEARGFYQRVSLRGQDGRPPLHAPTNVDRWMGDMAWLLLACLDYENTFDSDRYTDLATKLTDLLKSWFIIDPKGQGGYVQHGWRRGDTRLHEDHGHHEGNIDCYAAFMVLGERDLARQIRA
jgi:hypothetical protein